MNEHSVGFALKESIFFLVGDEREQALTVMKEMQLAACILN